MIDRLPPQSLEAEQSVLGAILIDRETIIEVAEFLRPEDFYRQAHGTIYRAMLDLFERREPVDIVTVSETLERKSELEGTGGRSYLSTLSNQTPTAVHPVRPHRQAQAVPRNLSGRRQVAGIGYEDPGEGRRPSTEPSRVFGLEPADHGQLQPARGPPSASDQARYIAVIRDPKDIFVSNYHFIRDGVYGPAMPTVIVVAARPSVGKTSFALNIAEYAAVRERKSVGVFSLEMSKEQLVLRLLSSVANIDSKRLRTGFLEEMDFARIAPAMNDLSEAPVYIDDTPNITSMELRTKARRLQAEAGLDLVIVDYLQLMQATTTNRDSNRVQEVSEISRGLKALARELSVPVIALSQLSRQPEMRESKEPRLSDLRESGAIEQDADLVIFLWREKDKPGEETDTDGEVLNVKLAKHRNGPTGDIQLWFKKSQTRFQSYAGQRYAEA